MKKFRFVFRCYALNFRFSIEGVAPVLSVRGKCTRVVRSWQMHPCCPFVALHPRPCCPYIFRYLYFIFYILCFFYIIIIFKEKGFFLCRLSFSYFNCEIFRLEHFSLVICIMLSVSLQP